MNSKSIDIDLIFIPSGNFLMGSDRAVDPFCNSIEEPLREVFLPGYWISKYPTTVQQYAYFVEDGGYHRQELWTSLAWKWRMNANASFPAHWNEEQWTFAPNLPVIGISWYEAVAYCKWLELTHHQKYRLPTEVEWEKAARGTDGRLFPWGNKLSLDLCNTIESGLGHTSPVDVFSPAGDSPYGCADMSGNVWEWCVSRIDENLCIPVDKIELQILRGGAWTDRGSNARCAFRALSFPDLRNYSTGFRVVMEAYGQYHS